MYSGRLSLGLILTFLGGTPVLEPPKEGMVPMAPKAIGFLCSQLLCLFADSRPCLPDLPSAVSG